MFLKKLLNEIEAVKDNEICDPIGGEVNEMSETVVGELPVSLRRLVTVRTNLAKNAFEVARKRDHAAVDEHWTNNDSDGESSGESLSDHDQLCGQYLALERQINFLDQLLWTEVRTEFPKLAKHDDLSLRDGWKIVAVQQTSPFGSGGIGELLEHVFGGRGGARVARIPLPGGVGHIKLLG